MYYADYHMHSTCSIDGHDTMADMARAAADFGLSEICFTDHCDIMNEDLTLLCDFSWDGIYKQYYAALMESGTRVKIKFGIELGEPLQNLPLTGRILSCEDLDFVIGSVHVLPEIGDFYSLEFTGRDQCLELIGRYFDELEQLARWNDFDVLGHITYPLRYMNGRGGMNMDFSAFYDRLEALFRTLIEKGRGIELNTSNLKHAGGETMPPMDMLELYRRLGGEIITLGSDAHRTAHVGSGIAHGYDLLGYAGFKYFTVYDHRKPEFIKL